MQPGYLKIPDGLFELLILGLILVLVRRSLRGLLGEFRDDVLERVRVRLLAKLFLDVRYRADQVLSGLSIFWQSNG